MKFVLLVIVSVLFISCSENTANDASNLKYMSITKAPVSSGIDITQVLGIEFSSEIDLTSLIESYQGLLDSYNLDVLLAPSLVIDSKLFPVYLIDSRDNVVKALLTQDENNANKIIVTPFKYLDASLTYTLVVTTALQDVYGKSLSENFELSFSVSDDGNNPNQQMSLVSLSPLSATVDTKTNISVVFDAKLAYSESDAFSVTDVNTSTVVNGSFEYLNASLTFTPDVNLILDHTYDVNITAIPIDMYGNDFNLSTWNSWRFTVNSDVVNDYISTTLYQLTPQGSVNIGNEGKLLRNFTNTYNENNASNLVKYIAVAKVGGVDFYTITLDSNATYPVLTKAPFSLSIDSEVTDMVFVPISDAQRLIVSTLNDGIFVVQTTDNLTLSTQNYLSDTPGIYGVGYGISDSFLLDTIYAVGPEIGMKILGVAVDGNVSLDANITIAGKPLKVVGTGSGAGGRIYIADYEQGVHFFNKSGDLNETIPIIGNAKFIKYTGSSNQINIINAIGNIYYIDTALTPHNANFLISSPTPVQDVNFNDFEILISSLNKGIFDIDVYYLSPTFFVIGGSVSDNVVSSSSGEFISDYITYMITLSKEGYLNTYFYFGGA